MQTLENKAKITQMPPSECPPKSPPPSKFNLLFFEQLTLPNKTKNQFLCSSSNFIRIFEEWDQVINIAVL